MYKDFGLRKPPIYTPNSNTIYPWGTSATINKEVKESIGNEYIRESKCCEISSLA